MWPLLRISRTLLDPRFEASSIEPPDSVDVLDSHGRRLGRLTSTHRRHLDLRDVPIHVWVCFVASEDKRFWRHRGIDLLAGLRALAVNIRRGSVRQGGSTITQQLVKHVFFSASSRWARKVPEIVGAVLIERRLTKSQILALYLNSIYFGGSCYGIAEAARVHYGKGVNELTPSEAAALAALVRAPNFYLSKRGRLALKRRADRILSRIRHEGLCRSTCARLPHRPRRTRGAARRRRLERESLMQLACGAVSTAIAETAGRSVTALRVSASLGAQHRIQSVLLSAAPTNRAAAIAMRLADRSVLAVATNPLAMPFATGRIQPGSALKPFLIVAALEAGYRLSDRFESREATLEFPGGLRWHVRNNAERYLGRIDLATALVTSDNSVFARLMLRLDLDHVRSVLRRFGLRVSGLTPAIALGAVNEGVAPLDLVNAYATLGAGGRHREPCVITSARPESGAWRAIGGARGRLAASPTVVREVCRVLKQSEAAQALQPSVDLAAKTGTAKLDQVVCAFDEEIAALVWLGRAHGIHEIDKGHSPLAVLSKLAPSLFGGSLAGL